MQGAVVRAGILRGIPENRHTVCLLYRNAANSKNVPFPYRTLFGETMFSSNNGEIQIVECSAVAYLSI